MTAMIQSDRKMEHVKVKVMAYIRKEKCTYNVSWGWTNGWMAEGAGNVLSSPHTPKELYISPRHQGHARTVECLQVLLPQIIPPTILAANLFTKLKSCTGNRRNPFNLSSRLIMSFGG